MGFQGLQNAEPPLHLVFDKHQNKTFPTTILMIIRKRIIDGSNQIYKKVLAFPENYKHFHLYRKPLMLVDLWNYEYGQSSYYYYYQNTEICCEIGKSAEGLSQYLGFVAPSWNEENTIPISMLMIEEAYNILYKTYLVQWFLIPCVTTMITSSEIKLYHILRPKVTNWVGWVSGLNEWRRIKIQFI